MFNNFRSLFIAFLAGLVLTMAGIVLRSMDIPYAGFLISTMMIAQAIALVGMIVLLIRKRR